MIWRKSIKIILVFSIMLLNSIGCKSEEEVTTANTMLKEKGVNENMIDIKVGDNMLSATLVDNSSTKALKEILAKEPITIKMEDYANMEKVGNFPKSLPRNDESIVTEAGDLILYQGNAFVIYYESNSWNFTRLGKINNITKDELKKILGKGDITVTLSQNKK